MGDHISVHKIGVVKRVPKSHQHSADLLLGGTHSRLPSLASHTWGNQPPVSDDQHQPPLRWIIELPRKWSPGSVACIVARVFPYVQTFPGFLPWIVVSLPEFSQSVFSWRELDVLDARAPFPLALLYIAHCWWTLLPSPALEFTPVFLTI